jgi:hypothetical protein
VKTKHTSRPNTLTGIIGCKKEALRTSAAFVRLDHRPQRSVIPSGRREMALALFQGMYAIRIDPPEENALEKKIPKAFVPQLKLCCPAPTGTVTVAGPTGAALGLTEFLHWRVKSQSPVLSSVFIVVGTLFVTAIRALCPHEVAKVVCSDSCCSDGCCPDG